MPDVRTFWSKHHDVTLPNRPSMDYVFIATNIICSIIDTHDVMLVHPIMFEEDGFPIIRMLREIRDRDTRRNSIFWMLNIISTQEISNTR